MKKLILSVLLTVVMLILMLPTAVFAAGENYNIFVGGVEITSTNLTVNGDTGTATYDPATSTLTLNNFSCSSDVFGGVINIQSSDSDITIKLIGNNTLTGTGNYTHGINSNGKRLVICDGEDGAAQGQLTINTKKYCVNASSATLEINGVKVSATSTVGMGLSADSISLTDITLSATADMGPICTDSDYLVDPETGEYVLDPETGDFVEVYGTINIENSTVEAYCTSGWNNYAFEPAPTLIGNYAVYAGNNVENATKVVAPTEDTYTKSKYVRIEPVCKVTVNYCIDGVDNKEITVKAGDIVSLETPVIDGYIFVGWYTDNTYKTPFNTSAPITQSTTVYAHWTVKQYTVTFKNADDTILQSSKWDYGSTPSYSGATPTKAANAQYTYTFAGWSPAIATVTGDATYTAKFNSTVNKYTITWNVDGNITTEQYEYGATPSFKGSTDKMATAEYTYTFAGWDSAIATVTGNATYTATYNSLLRTYGATVGESLHGSVTLTPDSTLVGDTITVTITPEAGYAVDTVTVTGTTATKVAENKYTFSMPTTDVVVNVTYKKIPYNVSAFGGGSATGGSYFVDKASATVGDTITITVAPNLGYLVEKVTFNGVAATNNGDGTYSFTMPAQEVIVSVEFDIDLPAIANELQKLNDADAALTEAMTDKDNDLTDEITALSNAIVSAQNAINDLDNSYATDAQLDALKTALEAADATMTNAINALESRVQDIEDALNGIDLSQIATNKQDIVDLTTELNNVKATVNQLDNTFINNTELANALATLKGELEDADDALEALITALTESVNKLKDDLITANGKIDTNASDISTLKTDVSTLKAWKTEAQAAIDALEVLTTTQGTNISALQTAVADLQTAVNTANGKIASAESRIAVLEGKVADLETATANLQNAVTTLQTAVAGKADTATVTAAIADLQTAIDALEAAKNNYIGADDTLRAELEAAIATAKGEAISAAETLVNNAKDELQSKIDAKADAATTAEAIQNLQAAVAALEAVKDDYATADANLKAELEAAIERAKQEAIEASKGYIPYIGTNGNWWIGDTDTGVDANGIKGDAGATGADGVGIAKIEKTSSDGNVDIYTITLTNGTTYTFTITNGTNETNGVDGKGSTDGADGQTPYVGENGNWCIGNTDTGVNAIVAATAVGGTALISNIALIAWALIKKKRFF